MVWEREWPLFSPGTGKLEWEYEAPSCLPWEEKGAADDRVDFNEKSLPAYLSFGGTPEKETYKIEDSCLKLKCLKQSPDDELITLGSEPSRHEDYEGRCAALVGRRQEALHVRVSTKMRFMPRGKESAGLIYCSQRPW